MFKNEPLWAVYAVLKQHYPHLAGGKTNKAFKRNLKKKKTFLLLPCYTVTSCCQLHHILQQTICVKCLQSLTKQITIWRHFIEYALSVE